LAADKWQLAISDWQQANEILQIVERKKFAFKYILAFSSRNPAANCQLQTAILFQQLQPKHI